MQRFLCVVVALSIGTAACGEQAAAAPKPVRAVKRAAAPASRPAPALVQIENSPDSRPHSGLQKADFVYEYLTEGGITRFTAVYLHPSGDTLIEPVRSTRLITLQLQKAFGGVIFTSGASDHVIGLIYSGGVPFIDDRRDGFFQRDPGRPAPHNLFTTANRLRDGVQAWNRQVTYGLPPRAEPFVPGEAANQINFDQTPFHHVTYTYSAQERTYGYSSELGPELDRDTGMQQIKVTNVVVLQVPHHGAGYTEDVLGAEGVEFDFNGSGPADVYTRGSHYQVRWDFSRPDVPPQLLTPAGNPMPLPPGLTWYHLVDPGTPIAIS